MRFRLLGPVSVLGPTGAALALPGKRTRALLALLLLDRPGAVSQRRLLDTVWAGQNPKDPVNALHLQIAKLRTAFAAADPEPRLHSEHGGYRLVVRPGELDVEEFGTALARGRGQLAAGRQAEAAATLRAALACWHGPALADLADLAFTEPERARLTELRLTAVEAVATAELGLGRHAALIPELTALTTEYPLRESLAGQLMLALHQSGRQPEALAVYSGLRAHLAEELGVDPSPELQERHLAVLRAPLPTGRSAPGPANGNLRHPFSAFIGRTAELTRIAALVDRHRLITLTGPGGVGKTRTALEAGRQRLGGPADGVWLVELAPLPAGGEVLEAVSSVLLPDEGTGSHASPAGLERLIGYLRGRDLLLVLDNCEHVVDSAATVVRTLLERCPGLRVLATSREALALDGEHLVPLAPLELAEAVTLFRDRAGLLAADLPADADTTAAVHRVCHRLDGLPLAVELAAARTRLFSVAEIESGLDERLRSWDNTSRGAPARHHTLRTVLDWSYELLPERERRVFTALSVFPGGCDQDAAERVCADERPAAGQVMAVLARLVDKSLLVPVRDGAGTRFRMLETVREFAWSAIDCPRRLAELRRRHAEAMYALAEQAYIGLQSPRQRQFMTRLLAELPNIRAAAAWLLEQRAANRAMMLLGMLGYFFYISGREVEGSALLARAVAAHDERPEPDSDRPFTLALGWRCFLGVSSGTLADPWPEVQRLRAVYESSANPEVITDTPITVAWIAVRLRDPEEADACLRTAEAGVSASGNPWLRSALDGVWSDKHRQDGDVAAAIASSLAALGFSESIGDDFGIVYSQLRLGDAEEHAGHLDQARKRWTQARDAALASSSPVKHSYAELRLAYLDLTEDPGTAAATLVRVRRVAEDLAMDDLLAAAANLQGLLHRAAGELAAATEAFQRAWEQRRAYPVRSVVAAAQLALLSEDHEHWAALAGQTLDTVTDRLALASLRTVLAAETMPALVALRARLPERPVATALTALA
ncbi:AfsR/SARP family transcriptional regulator [Crossiella cryophila]|uniref:Putative ATPase/DNA-binding SARP family transcriptional activator n=1 Tax=Crossiella cryophila TaxID=43355 RepID=A0A7W7CEF7_9PSEU|nr:AfsR/SARP family transcriptional regulator [Crossiella cryophila]MBB4679675.1 putative ATPase/DNA-binding SARP family transcriptional activator [Crossiella cryophila]